MEIFKLIFQHDLRLNDLDSVASSAKKEQASLADFLKPDPTYSLFHLAGTNLAKEHFGLNILNSYNQIVSVLQQALSSGYHTTDDSFSNLDDAISSLQVGQSIIVHLTRPDIEFADLNGTDSSFALKKALDNNLIVIQKIQAINGFDLQIYSRKNIYRDMFFPLQNMLPEAFRFFSINGKKFNTERHFYFETWTLDKPPHGFEEVFPQSII